MSASHEILLEKIRTLTASLQTAPSDQRQQIVDELKALNEKLEQSTQVLNETRILKG